jgi:hypothetical protein
MQGHSRTPEKTLCDLRRNYEINILLQVTQSAMNIPPLALQDYKVHAAAVFGRGAGMW